MSVKGEKSKRVRELDFSDFEEYLKNKPQRFTQEAVDILKEWYPKGVPIAMLTKKINELGFEFTEKQVKNKVGSLNIVREE